MLRALAELAPRYQRRRGRRARSVGRQHCDEIAHVMRVWIRTGLAPRGTILPAERDIAAAAAASRRTVRTAMERLCAEGLIERHVGRGTTVVFRGGEDAGRAQPVLASGLDLLEARLAIEPRIGVLAAQRATAADLRRMRRCVEMMRSAKDQVEFKKAGYVFHLEIARATRNPVLIAMYHLLTATREAMGWSELVHLNDTKALRDRQVKEQYEIYRAILHKRYDSIASQHEAFLKDNIADTVGG